MAWLLKLDFLFKVIARLCGVLASIAMLLLLLNVGYDVVMRYLFNNVSIGMQELEWHLYAMVFLLGTPYTMLQDGHVRVDIFYAYQSDKYQAWVNLLGCLLLVLPFILLIAYYGINFAYESYQLGEGSGDPGGLPYRWLIKSLIPISFVLMGLASLGMITQALRVLIGGESYPDSHSGDDSENRVEQSF